MSEDLELLRAAEGQRRLPTRRNFLPGSGAVAAAGVMLDGSLDCLVSQPAVSGGS